MLIQTAERRHHREIGLAKPGAWWPHNAVDLWWQEARKLKGPEMHALRVLDRWRDYATFQRCGSLFGPEQNQFIELTGANRFARCLDRVSVSSILAVSLYRKLKGNYFGYGFVARDTTTSTNYSIGLPGDVADINFLLTSVGAHTATIQTCYDQSGNSRDLTNGAPSIVNAGTLRTNSGGKPVARWNGSGDLLSRSDLLGLSGNPAIVVATAAQVVSATAESFFTVGRNAAPNLWNAGCIDDTHVFLQNGSGVRRFSATSVTGSFQRYIFSKASGDTPATYAARQNETSLSESSTGGTMSTALNLDTGSTYWGAHPNGTDFLNCDGNCLIVFASAVTGNDLDQLDRELLAHC